MAKRSLGDGPDSALAPLGAPPRAPSSAKEKPTSLTVSWGVLQPGDSGVSGLLSFSFSF